MLRYRCIIREILRVPILYTLANQFYCGRYFDNFTRLRSEKRVCVKTRSESFVSSILASSAMISEHNRRLKRRPCLHSVRFTLTKSCLGSIAATSTLKKLNIPFFFSITLIYISQPSFIKKTFIKGITHTRPHHPNPQI